MAEDGFAYLAGHVILPRIEVVKENVSSRRNVALTGIPYACDNSLYPCCRH
jgi:hypothetical protein